MQPNSMLMRNVEIEQAQHLARARAERRASNVRSSRGPIAGLIGRLWRR
ncbi:MAG TPA: hypothetical protein VEB65_04335 [Solirubrobacterales bacterium]|nr:hypothetical protein [Solirubrobacterales bacterium]